MTRFTYGLEMDEEDVIGWSDSMRGLETIDHVTYFLETDEENALRVFSQQVQTVVLSV